MVQQQLPECAQPCIVARQDERKPHCILCNPPTQPMHALSALTTRRHVLPDAAPTAWLCLCVQVWR